MQSLTEAQDLFIQEKVIEQMKKLGIPADIDSVNNISEMIDADKDFWNLVNSLFSSYIVTYAIQQEKAVIINKEAQ